MTEQSTDQPKKSGLVAEIWDWVKSIVIAVVIVSLLNIFVFNLSTVKGHSMEPTLLDGEWLFVNKIGLIVGHPKRGDVVILKDPQPQIENHEFLVKRVVALPGDKFEIKGGKIYLNDQPQAEGYVDVNIQGGDYPPVVIPEGHYFVMGDNRHLGESKDSREFGPVPEELIEGKASFILWPITEMGGL